MIEKYKEFEIRIVQDEVAQNPREDDNLGTILYTSSRYLLGDKQVTQEDIEEITQQEGVIWIPVYAYIHSGVQLSVGDFNDSWDSGCCGIIYTTLEKVKEFGCFTDQDSVKKILESEVETFSHYLAGEVYCYSVWYKGEVMDSCCGYYFYEMALEDAKIAADNVEINDCSEFKIVSDKPNNAIKCRG